MPTFTVESPSGFSLVMKMF